MIDPKQGPFPRLAGRDEAVISTERPATRPSRGMRRYGLRWARVQGRWVRDRRTTDDGFASPGAEWVSRDADRTTAAARSARGPRSSAGEQPQGRPARAYDPFGQDVRVAIDDPEDADLLAIDDPEELAAVPDGWVDEPLPGDGRATRPRPSP